MGDGPHPITAVFPIAPVNRRDHHRLAPFPIAGRGGFHVPAFAERYRFAFGRVLSHGLLPSPPLLPRLLLHALLHIVLHSVLHSLLLALRAGREAGDSDCVHRRERWNGSVMQLFDGMLITAQSMRRCRERAPSRSVNRW
jgi:hypothetical protein